MSKKGIKVMQTIENERNTTSRVALMKTVHYADIDKAWKKQLWERYRYVFDNEKYSDTRWSTPSEYGDTHLFINWDDLDKWQDSLKVYMLLLLNKNLKPYSTTARIKCLINFIKATNYFSEDCFVNFDDDPYRYCFSGEIRSNLLIFFEFIDIQPLKYIERLNELKFKYKVRDIPAFNSIYKFDKLIDNFKSEINTNNAFIVIVLWWELTKVIPIRPIEFFTLRKNSFFIDNNRCYVNVKRAKLRNKQYEIPILDKIGISKEIYDLFAQYIKVNEKYLPNPDSFLFNVEIFQNYTRVLFLNRTGYIGSTQMYLLFKDFFDDIIVKQYGYTVVEKGNNKELGDNEIEYFQFGDSRHIAFLNLLLSGFSPYTIAQIGGHTTICQQMHYYDHLDMYLASKPSLKAPTYPRSKNSLPICLEMMLMNKENLRAVIFVSLKILGLNIKPFCILNNAYDALYLPDKNMIIPIDLADNKERRSPNNPVVQNNTAAKDNLNVFRIRSMKCTPIALASFDYYLDDLSDTCRRRNTAYRLMGTTPQAVSERA